MSENGTFSVTVQYFAIMKDKAGCDEEQVTTAASTALELFEELAGRHGFPSDTEGIKVVVNEEFRSWDHPVADGDTVVFIPPVAGG